MSVPSIALKKSARNYTGLVVLGNRVITALTSNGSYLLPDPTLIVLQAAVTDVTTAIAAWGPKGNRGSHSDLVDLRNKALVLHQLLKAEAQYVELTAAQLSGLN